MISAAIEWNLVGEVIGVSFAAGLVVITLFALIIFGSTRAADARRAHEGGTATAFTVLAGVAGTAFAAVVVFALIVMAQKG